MRLREINGTQARRDDAEHHDEHSAATTLSTSTDATDTDAVFFLIIIKHTRLAVLEGGKHMTKINCMCTSTFAHNTYKSWNLHCNFLSNAVHLRMHHLVNRLHLLPSPITSKALALLFPRLVSLHVHGNTDTFSLLSFSNPHWNFSQRYRKSYDRKCGNCSFQLK